MRGYNTSGICINCNKPFPYRTWRGKKERRFCKPECYWQYARGKKHFAFTSVLIICKRCSKEKYIRPTILKKNGNYCSNICWTKSRCTSKEIACPVCGRKKRIIPSLIRKVNCCSYECHGKYVMSHMKTKNTGIEKIVRNFLKYQKIKFKSQYPLLNKYRADFYLPKYKLVIEADGDYYHNLPGHKEKDQIREGELIEAGYNIIRLKEKDLNEHKSHTEEQCIKSCMMKIYSYIYPLLFI